MAYNINSFDIDFGNFPDLLGNLIVVHRWIREIGIPFDELHGIAPVPFVAGHVVRVKLKTGTAFSDFMNNHEGVQQMKFNDKIITVTVREAGVFDKFVRIIGAPFEITDAEIRRKLDTYGKIASIKREKYVSLDSESSYFPVYTGAITVRMNIKMQIPSVITLGGAKVHVNYQGQPKTCFKCGKTGHIGANCTEPKEKEPRFPGNWAGPRKPTSTPRLDMVEFPELPNHKNKEADVIIDKERQEADEEEKQGNNPSLVPTPMNIEVEVINDHTPEEPTASTSGQGDTETITTQFFQFDTGSFDFSLPFTQDKNNLEFQIEQGADTAKTTQQEEMVSEEDADTASTVSTVSENAGGNKRKSSRNKNLRPTKEIKTTELPKTKIVESKIPKPRQQRNTKASNKY